MTAKGSFFLFTLWVGGVGLILQFYLMENLTFANQGPINSSVHNYDIHKYYYVLKRGITPISQLLQHPGKYHQKVIRLRGKVTRLELHLDESHHFIDFVFFLKDGDQRILVFGRHDRTQGDIQLSSDRMVEVQGLFWKERFANEHRFENNVEAQQIRFYPPLVSDQA